MTEYLPRLLKKASQPRNTRDYISAVAFDRKGNVLGYSRNDVYLERHEGGAHAEQKLLSQYRQNIHTIVIVRVGRSGSLRPIAPCRRCQALADKYGVKIVSVG